MTKNVYILYISLSGNTHNFVQRLTNHLKEQGIIVHSLNVKDNFNFRKLEHPFITILPAFLDGGNGRQNGCHEILSPILSHWLGYADNYHRCYGIIGSGNRNFNRQFALTAKQYARRFKFPYLTDFELRGSEQDVKRIANLIVEKSTEAE